MKIVNAIDLKTQGIIIGAQMSIPVNTHALARALEIEIIEDSDKDGFICFNGEYDRFEIHIGKNILPEQKRVEIARGIGNFLLQKNYIKEHELIKEADQTTEADNFAIELLMPFDAIDSALENDINTISKLAQHFGVTENIMRKRVGF